MPRVVYELVFKGEASESVRALFDDYQVTIRDGATTVRGLFPDQAALHGAIARIYDLGLVLVDVHIVASPAADDLGAWDLAGDGRAD